MTHKVDWYFEPDFGPVSKVICTFPEGSPCRMTCKTCGGLDDQCSDYHGALTPYGTCKIVEWADADDWTQFYNGPPAKPVDGEIIVEWLTAEFPNWHYAPDVEVRYER